MTPARRANATAVSAEWTLSLCRMRWMCVRTVLNETYNISPISVRDSPSIRQRSTSSSRAVSSAMPSAAGVDDLPRGDKATRTRANIAAGMCVSPRCRSPDRDKQRLDGSLFEDPAPDSHLHRLTDPVFTRRSRDDHDPESGPSITQPASERQPVLTSQVQVKGHHVNFGVQEQLQGLRR